MGACALVVESQDAVEERGMRGIVELLSTETRNSAFHATRLDVGHVASVVESLVASAERRFGIDRTAMAPKTVFMSHETYTPARGGSAAAEIAALREVFGPVADRVIVANTKGFTGHPMGVGIEDVIGVKILEHEIVPPVPNLKEPDPDLGNLTLVEGRALRRRVRHPPGGRLRLADRPDPDPPHPGPPRPRGRPRVPRALARRRRAASGRRRPRS